MICLIDEWIRQCVVLLLGVFCFGRGGCCWVLSEDVLKKCWCVVDFADPVLITGSLSPSSLPSPREKIQMLLITKIAG